MIDDIFNTYPFLSTQESDIIYKYIDTPLEPELVACGFMRKKGSRWSQYDFSLPFYSCFILLSGKGTYIDHKGQIFPIQPGSLVQRIPNEIHSTEVDPSEEWLEFFLNIGQQAYEFLNALTSVFHKDRVVSCVLTPNLISELLSLYHNLKTSEHHQLPSLLLDTLKMIMSLHENTVHLSLETKNQSVIEKACTILSSNLSDHISMEEIADELNMGYESFRKLFKNITGYSPLQYRTNQRIYKAQLSLLTGSSVNETAVLVGYTDCYSFSRQFTKTTGMSPTAFRKYKCQNTSLDTDNAILLGKLASK